MNPEINITIAGAIFDDFFVLGADLRATAGDVIADRNCMKLKRITDKIL